MSKKNSERCADLKIDILAAERKRRVIRTQDEPEVERALGEKIIENRALIIKALDHYRHELELQESGEKAIPAEGDDEPSSRSSRQ